MNTTTALRFALSVVSILWTIGVTAAVLIDHRLVHLWMFAVQGALAAILLTDRVVDIVRRLDALERRGR